ncbi:UDP-N-acetylmuramate--L-alanine ligase [Natroniella sulfidigena]|uniref:UDP-N-acetylmuramate--L-alanine ligase n=1 Tax=Natroniella sulfidigena TaxID=723921 RepID=UPI00200B43F6|nr:UDP-N-acetylmuramate--L-alanine ligase [Natroniella sulfidigena]MCK8816962.1 UDP-N-acetylmuramate--L-alanine ligase [Natroniella sulfidigena]
MEWIHIIGVGGIAMSAIAQYFLEAGAKVTGSDLNSNQLIEELEKKGAQIMIGHKQDNISADINKVIYSDAIPEDNVELVAAKKYNLERLGRSQALRLITQDKDVISATGTHGKTTTSAMIAQVLEGSGEDISFIIGGILNNFGSNFKISQGDYFVLEGDEYGRSFLQYQSELGVLTNIEFDHPDIYQDLDDLLAAYKKYVTNLGSYLVTNQQVIEQLKLDSLNLEIEVETVGINQAEATFNAVEIEERELTSYFDLEYQGSKIDRFEIEGLGDYNIKHALEAIAIGKYCGLSFAKMKEALKKWSGVKRRFEVLYDADDKIVITDYAHHPSEVDAVTANLERIKTTKKKVVIFQPHQYIRTNRLFDDYSGVLDKEIDQRIVSKIYKVREQVSEVEIDKLGLELSQIISSDEIHYCNKFEEVKEWLEDYDQHKRAIYLFLGAGDIDDFARKWVAEFD